VTPDDDDARLTGALRWVYMLQLSDFMLLLPLGPLLLRALGLPAAALGQLVFVYTLGAGVAGMVLGALIQRCDRRALLLGVYAGFALALLATAAAPSLGWLLAARALAGLCGGVLSSLVQAAVADLVALERRAAALGRVATGHALASVIGVPAGLAIASAGGWRLAYVALLVLALPVGMLLARRLPPWRPDAADGPQRASAASLLALSPAYLLTFLVSASAYAVGAYFAPYWVGNVGISEAELAYVYLAAGACSLVSSPLIGRLADRHGRFEVFVAVMLVSIAVIVAVTRSPVLPLAGAVVIGAAHFVTAYGRWIPALALLSALPRAELRASFMVINGVVTQLSMGAGALVAGRMIEIDRAGRLAGFDRVGTFAVALSLVAIGLAWRLSRRR